jgi:hypothetical protein
MQWYYAPDLPLEKSPLTFQVTLYANDENPDEPCSSDTQLEFPRIASCYNASWIYYSIDFCSPPSLVSSSSSNAPSPSSSSSASSLPSASNTPSSTSTSSPEPARTSHTGAIAGGIVGGVCGLALISGLVFFLVRRRGKSRQQAESQQGDTSTRPGELPEEGVKHEMYTHKTVPQEIGRNSVFIPPAELQGDEIATKPVGSDVVGGSKA